MQGSCCSTHPGQSALQQCSQALLLQTAAAAQMAAVARPVPAACSPVAAGFRTQGVGRCPLVALTVAVVQLASSAPADFKAMVTIATAAAAAQVSGCNRLSRSSSNRSAAWDQGMLQALAAAALEATAAHKQQPHRQGNTAATQAAA